MHRTTYTGIKQLHVIFLHFQIMKSLKYLVILFGKAEVEQLGLDLTVGSSTVPRLLRLHLI